MNYEDVKKCMKRLHAFHDLKLKVNHEFDIFGQMEFYETLWEGMPSVYKDYEKTKANVLSLKSYIDAHAGEKVLTHIDAVPDNFLFVEKDGKEEIRLIDWEYAGMQDPHVDVAMFCILLILLPIALLFAESSMNNLQSVSIVAAFPIGAVIVMIAVSFMKDAKKYMEELGNKK